MSIRSPPARLPASEAVAWFSIFSLYFWNLPYHTRPTMKPGAGNESSAASPDRQKDAGSRVPERKVFPLMKTIEDATALCEKEHDNFYLTAFMVQAWLGQLVLAAAAEYAEKKRPQDRSMQNGQAWRGFLEIFGKATDHEFPHILSSLFRYAEYDEPMADILRRGLVPLSVEHDCSGDYIGPRTKEVAKQPKEGVELARRSVARWCEWLDAVVHFQTHEHWHLAPTDFDPDPDKRELAALGTNQRHLSGLDDRAKSWWQWHLSEAAERFKASPKWPTVGMAVSAESDRLWPYREVDALTISLWPLLTRHNWTYCDLVTVIRPALTRPGAHPCKREQDFATYCTNVLGLRKATKGVTAKGGKPPGHEVAMRLISPPKS